MNTEIVKSLRKQANSWLSNSTATISQFVKRDERKYVDYLDNETKRLHTVSTATVLVSYKINDRIDTSAMPSFNDAMDIFNASRSTDGYWSSDKEVTPNLYEAAQILYAIRLFKYNDDDVERHSKLMYEYIYGYNPHSAVEPSRNYTHHPFLLFLATRSLTLDNTSDKKLLNQIYECFFSEMSYQLAFKKADDDHNFDPIRLGCATAGLLLNRCNWKPQLIEYARDLFMECQLPNGIWPSSPTIKIGKEHIGCSGLQIVFELITYSPSTWLLHQIDKVEKLFKWLKSHEIQRNDTYVWMSDITAPVPLWFNVLVLNLLHIIDHKFAQALSDYALSKLPISFAQAIPWDQLIDTGYKQPIEAKIINLFTDDNKKNIKSIDSDRSMILFGPPGTSKTSIARSLAAALGDWPIVELSPKDFCIQGMEYIFSRSQEIFEYLFDLEQVVVLFDEIDELVSMRETEQEKIGRFLTTAMLPWFQQLHDLKKIIFVVNTNHIRRYDTAIRRPGRFDLILPVGPPNKAQQKAFLLKKLTEKVSSEINIDKIFALLDGSRTISELLSLALILEDSTLENWNRICEDWNKKHPSAIDDKMLNDFEMEKNMYARD